MADQQNINEGSKARSRVQTGPYYIVPLGEIQKIGIRLDSIDSAALFPSFVFA